MTRISSLFAVATLAILPISAFAQTSGVTTSEATTPGITAPAAAQTGQPAAATPTTATPTGQTKANPSPKVARTGHGKPGTMAPSEHAKTAEPNQS